MPPLHIVTLEVRNRRMMRYVRQERAGAIFLDLTKYDPFVNSKHNGNAKGVYQ